MPVPLVRSGGTAGARAAGMRGHAFGALVGLAVVAAVGALVVGAYVGVPTSGIIVQYSATIFIVIPLVLAIALFVYMVRAALLRVPDPLAQLGPFVARRFGTPWLAAGTLAPILVVPLLMGAFGSLKQVMPLVAPFGCSARGGTGP